MNFSDNFKKNYWWVLLILLTSLCVWRIINGAFLNFDIYLFIFWFVIALFPIISEISLFGINVKKDIESVKTELKSQLTEIKNSISNHQNQTVTVHTVAVPADKREIEQKQKEDVVEEKQINKSSSVSISQNTEEKKVGSSEKAVERQRRIANVESLVNTFFSNKYGESYKPQIKIEDVNSGKKVVTDAIIERPDKKIAEIIEIKAIGLKSMEDFYFPASRFIQKLQKLGVRYPVRFVVVSEFMDKELALSLQKQIHHIGFAKALGANIPRVSATFLRLDEGEVQEIFLN